MANINNIFTIIMALVTLGIGLTIFDSLQTDITTLSTITNENTGTANGSGYISGSLAQDWTSGQVATCNGTVTSNVIFNDAAGTFVFDGADCIHAVTLVSYSYQPNGYISSGLGRTIIVYIVPIAMISMLVIATSLVRG